MAGLADLLTVEEAARVIRVGRTKAYAMAREWRDTGGRSGLPVIDLGHVLRVPRCQLEAMVGGPLSDGPGSPTATAAAAESDEPLAADLSAPERPMTPAPAPAPGPAPAPTVGDDVAGDVAKAVAWYRDNGRIVAAPERADALDAAVDAWDADRRAGHDVALLAWRRRDVAALNGRARRRCIDAGVVAGPEVEGPGGRRYAAGDRVVFLAPGDGRWVTSERARVVGVGDGQISVAFDDGRREVIAGEDLGAERLDHAYALTVHRTQAATVERSHVLADGGGRELAYVAMSRARGTSNVYVVADDVGQAAEDLSVEWRREIRQRWILDTDEVAGGDGPRRPNLAPRTESTLRLARLRSERDALEAVAPHVDRLHSLELQLRLAQVAQRQAPARGVGLR